MDIIQAVGKASFKAIPENFVVDISIIEQDSVYALCLQNLITKLNAIQAELKSIGLNEKLIKTTKFSISENYKYVNGNQVKNGYTRYHWIAGDRFLYTHFVG
ncbi:MAG: SIMPL domain-containing protein [Flavobacteriaceae bacterium]|nr:SIMPL domain-containing protein [Flavobacteriaceae bacterium]